MRRRLCDLARGPAVNLQREENLPREIIQPDAHWDPSPHFSHVSRFGNLVFIAGQTPMDAEGNLVGKGDIESQTRQVFENIEKCLASVGATFDNVVKLNTYSTDVDAHQPTASRVRREIFPNENVPSTYVQIPRLVHPEWLIEIEAVAVLD